MARVRQVAGSRQQVAGSRQQATGSRQQAAEGGSKLVGWRLQAMWCGLGECSSCGRRTSRLLGVVENGGGWQLGRRQRCSGGGSGPAESFERAEKDEIEFHQMPRHQHVPLQRFDPTLGECLPRVHPQTAIITPALFRRYDLGAIQEISARSWQAIQYKRVRRVGEMTHLPQVRPLLAAHAEEPLPKANPAAEDC